MATDNDRIKADMIDKINGGGAWFRTRENNYLKIARSDTEDCLYAMAFAVKRGYSGGASGSAAGVVSDKDAPGGIIALGDAAECGVDAGAYSFGTDWFDISFHGRLIDIYVDPDTLRRWEIIYTDSRVPDADDGAEVSQFSEAEVGRNVTSETLSQVNAGSRDADSQNSEYVLQLRSEDGRIENASSLALFCRQADREVREAIASGAGPTAFQIDGAGFAQELEPSEAKMGRKKSIFSLVDTSKLKKE